MLQGVSKCEKMYSFSYTRFGSIRQNLDKRSWIIDFVSWLGLQYNTEFCIQCSLFPINVLCVLTTLLLLFLHIIRTSWNKLQEKLLTVIPPI